MQQNERDTEENKRLGDLEARTGLREGDLVAGKYRIERVLGIGGMGVVVAAHHVELEEKVAIKVLLPELMALEEAVTRFAREARAAVKIKSEHVARVFDVGTLESGAPYIVMELLAGIDLSEWLARTGRLQVETAVDFVLQACVGVAEAHAIGIVHRDIKPANLFCTKKSDGTFTIKVLDFGISKGTGVPALGASVTQPAQVMGSPTYMSPEQIHAPLEVDVQADVWAMGITLYELLAGAAPFGGASVAEVAYRIASERPAPLREFRSDVPEALEAVILRSLEKDKMNRHANVAELAATLSEFGSPRAGVWAEQAAGILRAAGLIRIAPPSSVPRARTGDSIAPTGRTQSDVGFRGKRRLGLWAAGSALMIVAGGVWFAKSGSHPPSLLDAGGSVGGGSVVPAPSPLPAPRSAPGVPGGLLPQVSAPNARADGGAGRRRVSAHDAGPEAAASLKTERPAASSACSPPYTIDSAGHRQYKPECP